MFDNLSDRLGGVFDKLKGRGALPEKVVPAFSVRQRDQHKIAASNVKGIAHV